MGQSLDHGDQPGPERHHDDGHQAPFGPGMRQHLVRHEHRERNNDGRIEQPDRARPVVQRNVDEHPGKGGEQR